MSTTFQKQCDLQQVSSHAYRSSVHQDWTVGPTLFGGCVANALHLAATKHLTTTLNKYGQPHVHTLHIEFLRYCIVKDLEITVTDLKCGGTSCAFQLQIAQDGQIKVVAFATSTNFDKSIGPSVDSEWSLSPPPAKPTPDFARLEASQTDDGWIAGRVTGEFIPLTGRITALYPRGGYPVKGIVDAWYSFPGETMDSSTIALMCDIVPSMSDTMLYSNGAGDAHRRSATVTEWDREHPGELCVMRHTLSEAGENDILNSTLSMNIEFKKKLPPGGLKRVFSRTASKQLQGGRMDIHVTILDENMDLLCLSRQSILVLDSKRRLQYKPRQSNL